LAYDRALVRGWSQRFQTWGRSGVAAKAAPATSEQQSPVPSAETRPAALTRGRRPALVEVVLTNGRIVKVDETIDPDALARLLAVLDGAGLK